MRRYLIELRKVKALTQQDVAEKVGISRQYYNMIENGERQRQMDIVLAGKLAEVFGLGIAEIIDLEQRRDFESGGE